jgi:rhodanese-related sulfurtransferase/DNA-binding transcriptional ArsR family regulator
MQKSAREYKTAVYEQLALVGRALCSAPRLEIIDLLLQAERSVEILAKEAGLSLANTSHHLQVLKRARIVDAERRGQFVVYRIADAAVADMVQAMRAFGERRLMEIEHVTRAYLGDREGMEPVDKGALLQRVKSGDCLVLDVRPSEEFAAGHVAGALSVPLGELERRLEELPRDREIVAYCRGPYCVLAVKAVETLRSHGLDAVRSPNDLEDWRRHGLRIVREHEREVS